MKTHVEEMLQSVLPKVDEKLYKLQYVTEKNIEKSEKLGIDIFEKRGCMIAIDYTGLEFLDETDRVVSIGYSFTNPKDVYSKEKGLELAINRTLYLLDSKNYAEKLNSRNKDILWNFISHTINSKKFEGKKFPNWVTNFYNNHMPIEDDDNQEGNNVQLAS